MILHRQNFRKQNPLTPSPTIVTILQWRYLHNRKVICGTNSTCDSQILFNDFSHRFRARDWFWLRVNVALKQVDGITCLYTLFGWLTNWLTHVIRELEELAEDQELIVPVLWLEEVSIETQWIGMGKESPPDWKLLDNHSLNNFKN